MKFETAPTSKREQLPAAPTSWKMVAFATLLQAACVEPKPAEHVRPSKAVPTQERTWDETAYRSSVESLASGLPKGFHLDERQRKGLATVLLGETISPDASSWQAERAARERDERAPFHVDALSSQEREDVERAVAALPDFWRSQRTIASFDFISSEEMRKMRDGKKRTPALADREEGWKTLCTAQYQEQTENTRILCNLDEMRSYGWSEALAESFVHEAAHAADPTHVPFTSQMKAQVWQEFANWAEKSSISKDAYISWARANADEHPTVSAYAAYLQEAWAEAWSTQNAHADFSPAFDTYRDCMVGKETLSLEK